MKIITLEEHVATPEYVQIAQPQRGRNAPNAYLDAVQKKLVDMGDQRIADMDAAGVSVQVLSLNAIGLDDLDPSDATEVARDANDAMHAAVTENPERFAAFAALGMKEPDKAADELRRCVMDLNFRGAMVNGTSDGMFLDHGAFTPILATAQELGVPIYLHPAPPPEVVKEAYFTHLPNGIGEALSLAGWGWHAETGLHALRMIASGVFDRFPRLNVIIGHMGENLPFSIARADSVLSRSAGFLQRPIIDYFRENFYVTTSGYFSVPPFLCTLLVVGADRLMFSVDYPYSENTTGVEFLKSLPISAEDLEKVAHKNAEKLLRLT